MVVEADDTSDLPYSIFVLPEVNELRLADIPGILGMVETVNANLHRAIVGNGIHLKRPWNELSGHLATDVVLHTLNHSLPSGAQAALVMIELQIVGQQRSEFLQIAMVVGVEKFGIQRLDRLKQWRLDCSTLAVEISPLRSLTGSERYRLISPTIPRREHFCRKLSVRWVLGRDLLLGGSANGIVLLGLTIAGFLP